MDFAERREMERLARGGAVKKAGLVPAKAVDRASIPVTQGTSSEAAPPTPQTTRTPPSPHTDRQKGKEKVDPQSKRSRDGGDDEPPRKKPSNPRPSDSPELSDEVPLTARAAALRRLSKGSSSHPWTREGFILPGSQKEKEALALEIQRASPPLKNLQLNDHRVGRNFGKVVLHRMMDHDMFQRVHDAPTGVDNTLGHLGAHLSQVGAYIGHLGLLAASASSSRAQISKLEKKCADLEDQLSAKDVALVSAEEKLRTAEENVALVVAEKDKQSSDLMSFKRANEDLKAKLRDFDKRLKEAESRCRASNSKVTYYESVDYTTKVVAEYRASPEFRDELYTKCNGFYDRGCAHILRQFHHLIPDKALMCRAFEGSYANPEFRGGCDFVPFTASELEEIAAADRKAGRQWSPPAPVHPDLMELCDQLRDHPEESDAIPAEPLSAVGPETEDMDESGHTPVVEDSALGGEGAPVEAAPVSEASPPVIE